MKKREFEVDLEDQHVREMLRIAESESPRDFLVLGYLAHGLRIGEVIGEKNLPGLRIESFDWTNGIVQVKGKGYAAGHVRLHQQPVHSLVLDRTHEYAESRATGKLFRFSGRTYRWAFKKYARGAGVPGWEEAHPHRVRHWFEDAVGPLCKDPFETMGMMRHSKKALRKIFGSTPLYVRDPSLPRRRELTFQVVAKVLPRAEVTPAGVAMPVPPR